MKNLGAIAAVLVGLLLLGAVYFGPALLKVSRNSATAIAALTAANRHLETVKSGDLRGAYDQTSRGFRARTSFEAFERDVAARKKLYTAVDIAGESGLITPTEVTIQGAFDGPWGSARALVVVVREDDVWRLDRLDPEEPTARTPATVPAAEAERVDPRAPPTTVDRKWGGGR